MQVNYLISQESTWYGVVDGCYFTTLVVASFFFLIFFFLGGCPERNTSTHTVANVRLSTVSPPCCRAASPSSFFGDYKHSCPATSQRMSPSCRIRSTIHHSPSKMRSGGGNVRIAHPFG